MTKIRLLVLGFFFVVAFSVVIFRAVSLQLFPHDRVSSLAKKQLEHRIEIVSRRGSILDRNGKELAVSTHSLSIYLNPRLIKEPALVARALSDVTGLSPQVIKSKIREHSKKKFIWLARQLTKDQMEKLGLLDLKKLAGVGVLPEYRREFPLGSLASHVLGFVSVDGVGLEGVEKRFQKKLIGEKNSILVSRDALGRPVFSHREQIRLDLDHGDDVELTLDSRLQYSAEKAVKDAVEHHQAEGGSAVVMNPMTGEILALVNYPTFDSNRPNDSNVLNRRNRVITDPIEPGSVMKPFVVAKAIEDGIVTPESIIPTYGGSIKVGRKTIGEADAKHRFEQVSVIDLIRLSSNVGTVVLKNRLGWPKVEETFRKLGFGSQLGIELAGESKGIFRSPKANQLLEQATMSFGQGISATPLQIAQSFSVLANGGRRVRPHLYRENTATALGERVFSEATSERLRRILEKVVESEGTGVLAKVEGFKVAGKTGTSQRVDYKLGGYEKGAYWSSFAGFIPADKPRYVIVVVIDKPSKNGYYGGVVAAPAFSKIAQAAVRLGKGSLGGSVLANSDVQSQTHKNAKASAEFITELNKAELKKIKSQNSKMKVISYSSSKDSTLKTQQVPSLVGLPLSDALRSLQMGLSFKSEVEILKSGDVVAEQHPPAGSELKSGEKVYLKLR